MAPAFYIVRNFEGRTKDWLHRKEVSFEEHPLIQNEFVQPQKDKLEELEIGRKYFVVSGKWAAKWLVQQFSSALAFSDYDAVFCLSEKQKEISQSATKSVFVSQKKNSISPVILVKERNTDEMGLFAAFFHQMLENGIHCSSSGFKSGFWATSLTDEWIDYTVEAAGKSVNELFI